MRFRVVLIQYSALVGRIYPGLAIRPRVESKLRDLMGTNHVLRCGNPGGGPGSRFHSKMRYSRSRSSLLRLVRSTFRINSIASKGSGCVPLIAEKYNGMNELAGIRHRGDRPGALGHPGWINPQHDHLWLPAPQGAHVKVDDHLTPPRARYGDS